MIEDGQPQSAVTWVFKNSKHKGSVRFVLVALAECMNAGNTCPSHKDLAEMTQFSKGTVQHALGELEKDGTIVSTRNGGKKRQGGKTNCYRLAGYGPAEAAPQSGIVESTPEKTVLVESTLLTSTLPIDPLKHETPETPPPPLAPAHEGEYLNINTTNPPKEKEKDTLPAKAGKENARAKPEKPSREPTEDGLAYIDLLTAIGEVFGAFKIEATWYANMLMGRAKKGVWGQCAFEVPVSAAELRTWWRWYHAKFPTVDRVKEPPKVYSSITEWRNAVKPRPVGPVQGNAIPRMKPVLIDGQTGMHQTIPESELEKLRPSVWGNRR